jgi:CIC family chloride channel protein
VAAGAAAGFAAAYNTPIAAVLFVVEVVTGVVALEVLLPSAAAAALSTFVTRWAVGGGPLYGGRDFELGASADLALCLVLGVLAGLAGSAFMAMLSAGEGLAKRVALPRPLRGALGGLIVGALALFLPEVCGNGFEANQAILDGAVGAGLVAVLLIAKPLATAATVAGGSPGGVFTPSLFVGAALGGLFGAAAEHLPGGAAGGYAIIGMAAVISATTHAPLMAAVLLFEMSGDYALVLPLLLASAAAAVTARGIRPDSIYTEELRRRGIPWRGNLAERLARAVQARDILQMDPPQIAPSRPLDEALALLERSRSRVVYVVGDGAVRALTLYTARDIFAARARGEAVPAKTAGEAAQPVELASPDDTLLALSEKLWRVDFGELPVVEPGPPPALLGVVTRRDVLGAFDREVLQRDVLLTRVVWFEGQREEADYLELPPGQRVELIAPPAWLVGAAPDPDEIRRRFKVSLLAVRRGGEPTLAEPGSDKPLDGGDRLLVVGEPRAIEALRRSEAPPL